MNGFINKKTIFFSVILGVILLLFLKVNPLQNVSIHILAPTPTPTPFGSYTLPKLPNKKVYKIVLLGDSMTHALGPFGGRLLDYLQAKFVGKGFLIDNYAYSTNVLTLPKFLNEETNTWDHKFPPILSNDFDVIIIESFGYNPLSDLPREEGLKKQNEVLEQTVTTLIQRKPNALIVFMATIAPNKELYGKGTIDLTEEGRTKEVDERIAYIENHMGFARQHNIPLVDVYDRSLLNGDGNLKWINPDDHIHPSVDGIELISDTITTFLWDQNLIPH